MRGDLLFLVTIALLVTGCASSVLDSAACSSVEISAEEISAKEIRNTVQLLASDEFQGRAPGTEGEERTVAYLIQQFTALGLEGGGTDGSFTQDVPLVHTQLGQDAVVTLEFPNGDAVLAQGQEIAIETTRDVERIDISAAPVVFVGYGVSAPEREWDDFGDVDLRDKVALFLVNDPDFAATPAEEVAGLFGNRRMTYYGRWTYKFEEAARRGAVAALVIHETEAAGYGWNVAASAPGESYALIAGAADTPAVPLQGWLHNAAATALLAEAGHSLDELRFAARRTSFEAFELPGVRFSTTLEVTTRRINSQNVLARLPGAKFPDESIMLAAHWDAYGVGAPDSNGATVRPGANDDALGVAGVLDLARVLRAGEPLDRSVIFALWTAEESGLLGSKAYSSAPVHSLELTAANLTLDILQTAGAARDVILVGEGQSDLESWLARAAAAQGRTLTPESLPENGLFYRADHFSLARVGVPVLLLMAIAGAADLEEGGRAAGEAWIADYIGNCYHQTCDQISADWDLTGAVADIELYLHITRALGRSREWPQWSADSEFRAERKRSDAARSR